MISLQKILYETLINNDSNETSGKMNRAEYVAQMLALISNKYPNIAAKISREKDLSGVEIEFYIMVRDAFKNSQLESCLDELEDRVAETSPLVSFVKLIANLAIAKEKLAFPVFDCSWTLSLAAFFYRGVDVIPPQFNSILEVFQALNSHRRALIYSSIFDPELYTFNEILNGENSKVKEDTLYYREGKKSYYIMNVDIDIYNIPVINNSVSKTSTDDSGNDIDTIDAISKMKESMYDVFIADLKQRNIELPREVMSENINKKPASFSLEKMLSETWFNDDEVADEAKRTDYTKLILKLISGKYPNIAAKVLEEKDKQTNPESFIMTYGAFKKPELAECLDQLEDMVAEIPQQFSIMTIIDTLRTTREKLNPSIDNCSWILSLTAFFVYRGKTDWQIPHMDSVQDARQSLDGHNPDLIYDSASDPELYTFSQILKNEHFVHPEKLSYYQGQDIHYNFNITGVNSYNIPIIGNAVSETSTDDGGNDVTTLNVISKMKEQMYDVFIADLKEKNIQIPQEVLSEKFENESISVGGGAFSGGPMGMVGRSKKKHKHGF